jgi:LysM repeat protein
VLNRRRVVEVDDTPTVPNRKLWQDGEADLDERTLHTFPWGGVLILVVVLLTVGGTIGLIFKTRPNSGDSTSIAAAASVQSGVTRTPRATAPPTNTLPPTITSAVVLPLLALPTVTLQPPTPTVTPTRGPCVQKARTGDTLGGLAARCGVYTQSAIATILSLNHMTDAGQLQVGQTIIIPWPTSTGPAPTSMPGATVAAGGPFPTSTLPPGLKWYTVLKDDDAISIAYRFKTTIKTLHDLNPELASRFSQCDYGLAAGGSSCTVQLGVGEQLRVPIPLPTPTLSPTPNGSETVTPSMTPTFNAPYLVGPGDNMLFGPIEFPVLRWGASDKLSAGQTYILTVIDITANKTYRVPTTDLSFQVPLDWQPNDGTRHEYQWSVSVAMPNAGTDSTTNPNATPAASLFTTENRTFTWQGSGVVPP